VQCLLVARAHGIVDEEVESSVAVVEKLGETGHESPSIGVPGMIKK
jgi:hypothetical protein